MAPLNGEVWMYRPKLLIFSGLMKPAVDMTQVSAGGKFKFLFKVSVFSAEICSFLDQFECFQPWNGTDIELIGLFQLNFLF